MEEYTMGLFTKDIKTMEDLFLHQLEDIYYAEQQLTKAIPKMADMATNAELKAGLEAIWLIPTTRSSGWIRFSPSWVKSPRRPIVRRLTALSRKLTRPRARSRTNPCWMRALSPTP